MRALYVLLVILSFFPLKTFSQEVLKVMDVRANVLEYSQDTLDFINSSGLRQNTWHHLYWHSFKDWNKDSKIDVVLGLFNSEVFGRENEVVIGLFEQGDNYRFYENHTYLMYVDGGQNDYSRSVADFTGNGLLDIFIPSYYHPNPIKNKTSSIFINNGNGFDQTYLDSTVIRPANSDINLYGLRREDFIGNALNLEQNNKNHLYVRQSCYEQPYGMLFRRYQIESQNSVKLDYVLSLGDSLTITQDTSGVFGLNCWETNHTQVQLVSDTLYAALQNSAFHNNKGFSDYKICKWSVPINTVNDTPVNCIDLKRDPNVYQQRDIVDNFGFWVVDLTNDGDLKYVLQLFSYVSEDWPINSDRPYYHSSIHVYNSDGTEITTEWFNSTEYLEKNNAHANGIYVLDMNDNGLPDILPINGFFEGNQYSQTGKSFMFMNNGDSFVKKEIQFTNELRSSHFVRYGAEYGFKFPIDLSGDGKKEIFHIKMGSFDQANVDILFIDYGQSTSTTRSDDIPSSFQLHQNYPNPFNPSTQIGFSLPQSTHVRLEVFSITGQSVTVLKDESMSIGNHTVTFNGSNLSSGVYIYRLTTSEYTQTRLMNLIK